MEGADHLERGLRHGLLEVAAGRAHGAADGHRADRAVVEAHVPGALVEGRDHGLEVGGEGLLAGDLLEAPGHLAQRLRPARGGVGQQEHLQAHLAVVLGDRHGRVHGGLAGRHRHGARVADDDGALHEAAAGARVGEHGELAQRLHDLAGALAAGRHDHHVDVGVAAGELLQHGLAGAERPGDAVGAALGHREERVEDAHLGDQLLASAAAARRSSGWAA